MAATVAMIGLTHPHSASHLDTLGALDEVEGIVLYDPDAAARAESAQGRPKVIGADDDLAKTLARPEVTHVLVAVPTDQSPGILVRAIEAGKHVYTEKPGARNAAEFAPVLDALARRPVAFAVAFINRWHPGIRQMRELYRQGAIGRLLSVELRMVTTQVRFRDPNHWLFKPEIAGGGIVSWLGCHWLDMTRYLTGEEFTATTAQIATTNGEPIGVEDTAAVSFRLSGGAVGSLHAGYLLASGTAGYHGGTYDIAVYLRGSEGSLIYRRDTSDESIVFESILEPWRAASPQRLAYTLPPAPGYGGAHGLDFVREVLAAGPGDPIPAGALDAQRVLEVLDEIYKS